MRYKWAEWILLQLIEKMLFSINWQQLLCRKIRSLVAKIRALESKSSNKICICALNKRFFLKTSPNSPSVLDVVSMAASKIFRSFMSGTWEGVKTYCLPQVLLKVNPKLPIYDTHHYIIHIILLFHSYIHTCYQHNQSFDISKLRLFCLEKHIFLFHQLVNLCANDSQRIFECCQFCVFLLGKLLVFHCWYYI